jgi:hypothetical protein
MGFLNDRRQRLLRHAAGLEKARKVAPVAQFGDAQLNRAGARLPVPVAVAVALVLSVGRAFAGCGPAKAMGLQRHQAFGGEADHLAQECGVGARLQKRAKGDLIIGHRGCPRVCVCLDNPTLPNEAAVTTAVGY